MSLGPKPYNVRVDARARMPCACAIVMLAVLVPQKQRSLLAFSQKNTHQEMTCPTLKAQRRTSS